MDQTNSTPKTEEELRKKLTPEQYHILREKGTEVPGSSPLLYENGKGMFVCVVCGNQLFSSDAKFESGTGWPSFDQALPGAVKYLNDISHGMERTEVVCGNCGSHLGHVFDDGPSSTFQLRSGSSTGKRFCINGACLLIKPTDPTVNP